jgi:Cu(I)/Ag(I) efflux system membrane fusion protein
MKQISIVGMLAGLAVAAVLGGYVAYQVGLSRGMKSSAPASPDAPLKVGDVDPATGKRVLYWHDPMVPNQRFDAPGQSPFMNMKLVAVYEGQAGGGNGVEVSSAIQQSLGIRTAEVVRAPRAQQIEVAGNVAFDERDQAVLQARATAYVEKLHVRATLDRVAAGAALAELYVPDWVAAQEEFLSVRRMRGADLDALADAARARMRQAGMSDEQIEQVAKAGAVQPRITLRAPIAGVVVELGIREGMTVMPGQTLFRINGLSTVWVNAAVPESLASLLRPGAKVEARTPAIPNTTFDGSVQAILPDIDLDTRTIKARVELANPGLRLAPGMFATVALSGPTEDVLLVPTEAVIETGRRKVVMLANANGTFEPVDVEIGAESNGQTEITRGLTTGQRVVVSGQFLIDSEASLRATSARMESAPAAEPGAPTEHTGTGKIEALGPQSVTLSHGPIPSMQWGAMTMEFGKPANGLEQNLQIGESVSFAFTMGPDGKPQLTRIEPATESAR